jgi:hypothetical protein
MEAYPSSNKQTHLKKERKKTKNPSNHNVKQNKMKTKSAKTRKCHEFDG